MIDQFSGESGKNSKLIDLLYSLPRPSEQLIKMQKSYFSRLNSMSLDEALKSMENDRKLYNNQADRFMQQYLGA